MSVMHEVLVVLQIIISVVLAVFILIQVKGNGFGRVWGTGAQSFTRRGLEALVFKLTFVVSFLFLVVSIAAFLV